MTGHSFLDALIYLVVVGLILWVLWWGKDKIGLPEPFNKIVTVLLVLATVVVLIDFLLSFTTHGGFIHLR